MPPLNLVKRLVLVLAALGTATFIALFSETGTEPPAPDLSGDAGGSQAPACHPATQPSRDAPRSQDVLIAPTSLAPWQQAKFEFDASDNYRALIQRALSSRQPDHIEFATKALSRCMDALAWQGGPALPQDADPLIESGYQRLQSRCAQGFDAQLLAALKQAGERSGQPGQENRFDYALPGKKSALDAPTIARIKSHNDGDLLLEYGIRQARELAADSIALAQLHSSSELEAGTLIDLYRLAWRQAACEQLSCDLSYQRLSLCMQEAACSQPSLNAQIQALASRHRPAAQDWTAVQTLVQNQIRELLRD